MESTDSVATCENNDDAPFSPMAHQKIVRDYMSKFSPYRGILVPRTWCRKTCSSIAIKRRVKQIDRWLSWPCVPTHELYWRVENAGDDIYKKNQYWEFVNHNNDSQIIDQLSGVLSLPTDFIQRNGGAWLVNVSKPPNFESLSTKNKKDVDIQINMMISQKYKFINYNGLRKAALATLSMNGQINPTRYKVVVIDEAHNFVGWIVKNWDAKTPCRETLWIHYECQERADCAAFRNTHY